MRNQNTQPLGEVIREYFKALGIDKKMREMSVINNWENIVGKSIFRVTREIFIANRRLYLKINSAVVKNEILMLRTELISRINDYAGDIIVNDIVVF